MTHTCNPSSHKVEGSEGQGHLYLYSDFRVTLGYTISKKKGGGYCAAMPVVRSGTVSPLLHRQRLGSLCSWHLTVPTVGTSTPGVLLCKKSCGTE